MALEGTRDYWHHAAPGLDGGFMTGTNDSDELMSSLGLRADGRARAVRARVTCLIAITSVGNPCPACHWLCVEYE